MASRGSLLPLKNRSTDRPTQDTSPPLPFFRSGLLCSHAHDSAVSIDAGRVGWQGKYALENIQSTLPFTLSSHNCPEQRRSVCPVSCVHLETPFLVSLSPNHTESCETRTTTSTTSSDSNTSFTTCITATHPDSNVLSPGTIYQVPGYPGTRA